MSIEVAVLEKLRDLPVQKQLRVLEYVEELGREPPPSLPRKRQSIEGLFASEGISISAEEIEEARREMWARFPREFE